MAVTRILGAKGTGSARSRRRAIRRVSLAIRVVVLYAAMGAFGVTFLFPFVWMLSTSLKPPEQVWVQPPVWIPRPIVVTNYYLAFTAVPTLMFLRNTLIITLFPTVGTLLASSCVAFAFARLYWPGRSLLFALLLSTMMLPGQVTMIPVFVLFHKISWIDTFKPFLVPSVFGSAFYIFLLRQFFTGIPKEMDEAAIIDGATPPLIWWRITLPLSGPALAAVAIFSFIGHWNEFLGPLIYLKRVERWPLALGLLEFRQEYRTSWEQLMAYSLMVMLPCLLVFFFAQRYFIQGITLSGLKG